MSSNREFIFTWVIENFKLFPMTDVECISSPTFSVKEFLDTDWYLEFYFLENDPLVVNYVSCYLNRCKDTGPQEIGIDFQLSISGETHQAIHCFKTDSMSTGFDFYAPREENGTLVGLCIIQCNMKMSFPVAVAVDITEQPNHFLMPYSSSRHIMMPNILKESSSFEEGEVCEIAFPTSFNSNQILARTRVSIQRRIFICAIKDYLYPGSNCRQVISVDTPYGTLIIVLFMRKNDYCDLLDFEMSLKGKWKSNCMLVCQVELIDSENKIYSSKEGEHIFENDGNKHWNFGRPLKWSDLKNLKKASLRFTLTLSNGQYFSEIDWSTGVNECNDTLNFSNDVTKNLHRLFREKKFCDVTIKTSDESISTHKTILCSGSPVFAAMFESDMKESDSNVIEIADLDSDTVRHMLRFMYTGNTEKLNADIAMKLYSAADKYQIMSMKGTCRKTLKRNLTVENVCFILVLADACQDDELLKSAITFVSCHRERILKSENWKELKENRVYFCLDILTKVCMKLFP